MIAGLYNIKTLNMGSATQRKNNDQPIIRLPLKKGLLGTEAPGDKGGIVADMCIPSFEQKITKTSLTKEDVPVRLKKEGSSYSIYIGENPVGVLNAKHSEMIVKCGALGVRYVGKVVEKKSNVYARFVRVSG